MATSVTKGHRLVRLENQCSLDLPLPLEVYTTGQYYRVLPSVRDPWSRLFCLVTWVTRTITGHTFMVFRKRHLFGPGSALKAHDFTRGLTFG